MEIASSVMRFALATYLMKHGTFSSAQAVDNVAFPSPSYEPSITSSCFSGEEVEQLSCDNIIENPVSREVGHAFSDVVRIHISNLSQLLSEQRFREYSQGIADLRQYATSNELLPSLITVLISMLEQEELNAESIAQVIEHMCFESSGEPTTVFDKKLVELVFEALQHCCENKKVNVAIWLLRALDGTAKGLRRHQEQRYGGSLYEGLSMQGTSSKAQELIRSSLVNVKSDSTVVAD